MQTIYERQCCKKYLSHFLNLYNLEIKGIKKKIYQSKYHILLIDFSLSINQRLTAYSYM